jgi:hypothetical protein
MAKSSRGDDVDQITIINTEARFKRYPLQTVPERFKDEPARLQRIVVDALVLKPGAQRVDRKLWEHPHIQAIASRDVDSQILRVLEKPIHTLQEGAALRLIRMTIDRPILLGAQAKETRPKVKKAILKQLREIGKIAHVDDDEAA